MKKFKYNKIIGCKALKKLETPGVEVSIKSLSNEEFKKELFKKLIEEAEEVELAKTKEEMCIEISDVIEVIHAIAKTSGISLKEIEEARLKKKDNRGDFSVKAKVEWIAVTDCKSQDSRIQEILRYHQNDPEKYQVLECK